MSRPDDALTTVVDAAYDLAYPGLDGTILVKQIALLAQRTPVALPALVQRVQRACAAEGATGDGRMVVLHRIAEA